MARSGVNYANVLEAAESITSNGDEPTVDRVRLYLGTGSKSTIAPLLKRWKNENTESAETGGLPNDVVQAVKALQKRLMDSADDKIVESEKVFAVQIIELRESLQAGKEALERAADREKFLLEQQKDSAELESRLQELQLSLVSITAERDTLLENNTELKRTHNELKSEIKGVREQTEHYQERTAADREAERVQYQQMQTELKSTNKELRSALQNALQKNSDLTDELGNQNRRNTNLEQVSTQQKHLLEQEEKKNASLNSKLEALENEREKLLEKSKKLESNALVIKAKRDHLIDTNKQLETNERRLEKQLDDALKKWELLNDENRGLIEEKAILRGQLVQVQKSL